jgi:hypothetical protein
MPSAVTTTRRSGLLKVPSASDMSRFVLRERFGYAARLKSGHLIGDQISSQAIVALIATAGSKVKLCNDVSLVLNAILHRQWCAPVV